LELALKIVVYFNMPIDALFYRGMKNECKRQGKMANDFHKFEQIKLKYYVRKN